jgi:hypothetical protein
LEEYREVNRRASRKLLFLLACLLPYKKTH